MSKRLLSALVALCMALTLMPSWAFADEPDEALKDPPENAGAVLDGEEDKEKDPEPGEDSEEEGSEGAGENTPEDSDGETPKDDSEETPKAPDGEANPEAPVEETPETSEEETPAPEEGEEVSVTVEIPLSVDSDRLLMDYIENTLGVKEENTPAPAGNGMRKVGRRIAQPVTRESLDSDQKVIYDALKEMIDRVVQSGGSTEVTLGSASNIVIGAFEGDKNQTNRLQAVVLALQNDCAEKLYWYGHSISSYSSGTKVAMAVAEVYQTGSTTDPGNGKNYELNSSLVLQLNTALKNAKTWADEINTAGGTDFNKLLAAGMKICEAVDYHPVGNGGEHFSPLDNSNPWEIIHVFDNDPSTKVVCEGYSKAFQYLCRMMSLDEAQCYTVTGKMNGGDHMWNIVRLDGKSYLVDVTNSDDDSAGSHFRLFMKGYIADPTKDIDYSTDAWSEKYTSADNVTGNSYVISTGRYYLGGLSHYPSMGIKYVYDGATLDLYDAGILTLTDADYEPPAELKGTVAFTSGGQPVTNSVVYTSGKTVTAAYTKGAGETGTPSYQWLLDGTEISGAVAAAYTLKASDVGHTLSVRVTLDRSSKTFGEITVVEAGKLTSANFNYTAPAPLVYDGNPKAASVTMKSTPETAEITFETYYTGVAPTVYAKSETAPTNAGTYQVTVETTANANYDAANIQLGTFEITKATPTLSITGNNSMTVRTEQTLTAVVTPSALASSVQWSITGTGATLSAATGASVTLTAGAAEGSVTVKAALPESGNYEGVEAPLAVTISNKPVQRIAFNLPLKTKVQMDGTVANTATPQLPIGETTGTLGNVTYSSSNPNVATVNETSGLVTPVARGTTTITATVAETAFFGSASVSYKLEVVAQIITPTISLTPDSYVYTGRPIEPQPVVKTAADGVTLTLDEDYTLEWDSNTDVGTATVTVEAVAGGNYSWEPMDVSFTITKAAAPVEPAESARTTERYYAAEGAQTFSIASLFGSEYEITNGTVGAVTGANPEIIASSSFASGTLSFTLTGGAIDNTATIPVLVSFRNHEDVTVNVIVKLVDLPKPYVPANVSMDYEQAGTDQQRVYVNATTQAHPEITEAQTLEFQFTVNDTVHEWQESDNDILVPAGASVSAKVRVKALAGSHLASEVVNCEEITTPPAFTPNGGTFRGSQEVTLSAPGAPGSKIYYTTNGQELDPSLENGTEYTEAIKLTSTTKITAYLVDGEGHILSGREVTFTRRSSSSGGSSSSGESIIISGGSGSTSGTGSTKPSTTPSTPGVSSGSDTTTAAPSATVKDGTASATVGGTLGKDLVDQAVANGSDTVVIAPSIPSSADQTDVSIGSSVVSDLASRTDADLRVETPAADVTISGKGLSGLAGKGGSVVVSTSAKGDTFDISITAGGSKVDRVTGGVKVEIPTSCTPGTVAMVTKADGTTELVRKSVANASYGTVTVPLEGSATITLMDNSKSFSDVPAGNTFAGAVAFVSSREIMSGTGADTFNPSAPLTRAQLAKILHNLESNPSAAVSGAFSDVAGGFWSAEAIQWASDKGIVTGYADGSFKPNNYITREQLAVMLYRYAGSPNIRSSELRFSDAASVGSYAQAAMIWATQNGVINGSGGMLNPKGQATRAQAAQMLLNYMNNVG